MIAADSAVFALGAMINAVPEDFARPRPATPVWKMTAGQHFRFGYDAEAFALRRSGAARYWTAYGACAGPHEGFARELARALAEIVAASGSIAIAGTGGPVARASTAIARRLGADAIVVRPEFIEHPEAFGDVPSLPVVPVPARFAEFTRFAIEFAARVGGGDAWTALAAFLAGRIDRPMIADQGELRLVNNGIDEVQREPVAPALVTLVDNETFTAFDRWLLVERRRGIAQLLRWSPALMAAQLDAAPCRAWLVATATADASATANGRLAWTNRAARLALWRQSFPEIAFAADAAAACRDHRLVLAMRDVTRRMRRAAPGCRAQHHTPLHRLAQHLGVVLEPSLRDAASLYGAVNVATSNRSRRAAFRERVA